MHLQITSPNGSYFNFLILEILATLHSSPFTLEKGLKICEYPNGGTTRSVNYRLQVELHTH